MSIKLERAGCNAMRLCICLPRWSATVIIRRSGLQKERSMIEADQASTCWKTLKEVHRFQERAVVNRMRDGRA